MTGFDPSIIPIIRTELGSTLIIALGCRYPFTWVNCTLFVPYSHCNVCLFFKSPSLQIDIEQAWIVKGC